MSLVEVSILIDAPLEDVFEQAMDPNGTLQWVTIAREVKDVKGDFRREGFEMKQQLCLRGVPFWVTWDLVEVDAPRFARFEGKGPMRSKAIIENRLEAEGNGTRFRYRNEFKAPFGPLGATAERVVAGGIPEREALASLENLKRLAESRVRT
ncbi:MAG TPA: SRPBCC family protein [Solirubrobacteraceae bacterium]|nr:SRPBCC family protein [Solirubrobacteraceae bacterium]